MGEISLVGSGVLECPIIECDPLIGGQDDGVFKELFVIFVPFIIAVTPDLGQSFKLLSSETVPKPERQHSRISDLSNSLHLGAFSVSFSLEFSSIYFEGLALVTSAPSIFLL
ncbi:hypothetical protein CSKR_107572 [Clonorchis sinensis]|uniref:Uncharacterized protein n=1 Tax=Clonorchis sinensis TaxID=79923 RepID=A0A419PRN5_CLOSI|nr:hypothetical protein CSKR_107572 [Clonorchis sinensis]